MEYRNCPRCGALFPYISSPICEKCVKEEEELFQGVRTYVKEHPNATILEVSTELGISTQKIYKYLREGKLELINNDGIELKCDRCGKPITSGRYCKSCTVRLEADLSGVYQDYSYKRIGKMHTYKREKGKE